MKFVTADKSLAFTEPQQQRLMEAASIRLSSTVVDDGTSPIHFGMHGPSKAQTHMCSFNYYNDDDWGFFGGPEPFTMKFRWMSRKWLGFGLRFPSGHTFRIGLATIFVASKTGHTYTALHVHSLYKEFTMEFGAIRSVTIGEATFKNFPSDVETFKSVYPGLCDGAVACRVDARLIREMATKEHIPIKTSNKKICFKQSETPAASSGGSSPRSSPSKELLEGLVAAISSCRSPSNSPPPGRRPSDADLADTQARRLMHTAHRSGGRSYSRRWRNAPTVWRRINASRPYGSGWAIGDRVQCGQWDGRGTRS